MQFLLSSSKTTNSFIMSTRIRASMSNYRRRLAGALVLLMLLAPITNAATTSWAGPSTVNTAGGSTTLTGFRAPGNATIMDGWAHVTDSPMAASLTPATEMDIFVLENGTSSGTTTEYRDGNLTLVDDGSLNDITHFDNYSYSISLSNDYIQGPANIIRITFENSAGYAPHPSCNGLTGYNLTSGYDENRNGLLDSSEVTHVDYLCANNQTIQGGNGAVSNGTVVNGSFQSSQGPIAPGNSTCCLLYTSDAADE